MLDRNIKNAIFCRNAFRTRTLTGYFTQGGTYIIAMVGGHADNGQPRDLVAVLRQPLGGRMVLKLDTDTPTVLVREIMEATGEL